jgi:hypothetical protein
MKRWAFMLTVVLCLNARPSAPPGHSIPATHAVALDGHTVELPKELRKATVLVLGFSRNSEAATTAWEKQMLNAPPGEAALSFYDLPMLAEVPAVLRGMVVRSIRKKIPEKLRPNFVPLTDNEDAWKQLVGFTKQAPDAAYLLLVDHEGVVRWSTHAACTTDKFAELYTEARKLEKSPQ